MVPSKENGIPPGWDYNPSTWKQRVPLVVIAFLGFLIAMYLSAYQMEWIDSAWDPFFADGTNKVLDSKLSEAFPIPDALLGAFSYLLDVVTGIIGDTQRWKTKPWMVIVFGLAIGPLGLVSIFLVIAQPVIVGYWCTLCICSAVISVVMISPALDEFLASLQYLKRVKQQKLSFWKAFWGDEDIYSKIA